MQASTTCHHCDTHNPPASTFCNQCGQRLSSAGQATQILVHPGRLPHPIILTLVVITIVGGLLGYATISRSVPSALEPFAGTWLLGSLTFEFDFANQQLTGFPVGAPTPSTLVVVSSTPNQAIVMINGQRTRLTLQCDGRALLMEPDGTIPEALLRPGVILQHGTATCT